MTNRPKRGIVGLIVILANSVCLAGGGHANGPPANGTRKPEIPTLTVTQFTLGNGLRVILHEDHKTPLVSVNICYNVGSKDDPPGRTGFAHLFEHMMFTGSLNNNQEFGNRIHEFADETNATTSRDQTVYYETITANALERTLWLEADRMGYLLPVLTLDKLNVVRNVVKNERRSTNDNVPYGLAEEVLRAELYPAGHPYRHLIIGSHADLSAARISEIREFFKRHYVPNNAVLCVVGNFQPDQVRRWIETSFGPLARGAERARSEPNVPRLVAPKHITLTDGVSHSLAKLVWPTVPAGHRDEPALDLLSSVLGNLAKESRLYRRLVYEHPLAVQVDASHPTYLLAGEFEVDLYAQPGQKLSDLVRSADEEIERLKHMGPSDAELRRAKNQRELSLILSLESARGQADVLGSTAARLGDPLGYRAIIEDVFAVTPKDVIRVARQYLGPGRIELDVLPGARTKLPADLEIAAAQREALPLPPPGDPFVEIPEIKPAGREAVPPPPRDPFDLGKDRPKVEPAQGAVQPPPRDPFELGKDRPGVEDGAEPAIGPMPRFTAPKFVRRVLSNGLVLRIVERHDVPLVALTLTVRSGETSTPPGKEGLCSITANLLDEGTTSRTALEIAGSLSEIGASISSNGWLEYMDIRLTTLSPYLEQSLDIYTDVILNPKFAAHDLERLKFEQAAERDSRADHAEVIASDVFEKLVYPREHLYGRPWLGTTRSIRSITRDDVVGFYRKTFVPGNAELVIVGDVAPEKIITTLEARLGSWQAGPIPPRPRLSVPAPSAGKPLYLIDLPGASQSVITIGRIGPAGASELHNAVSMVVSLCEGRINSNIREEKGFSYALSSDMRFRKGPGTMSWSGPVQTSATRESLIELMKEIVAVTGPEPASNDEIAQMETSKSTSFFGKFETTAGIAYQVSYLVAYNLGDDYYATRLSAKYRVTKDELVRVAKEYLKPELMTILVVGDRSKIEGPLRSIPFVNNIRLLDQEGNPLPEPVAPKSVAK